MAPQENPPLVLDVPLSVSLFRDVLLIFPVINLSLILAFLSVGFSISGLSTVLSIPLCFFLAHRWHAEKAVSSLVKAAVLFAITCGAALLFSICIIDMEYDSRSYHGPAVIALSDGWNPIREPEVCRWSEAHCTLTNQLVVHYPKAQWFVSASLYRVFGDIDSGKSMNVLMLVLAFIVSSEFSLRVCRGRRGPALLLGTAFAANPVALAQLFCGYQDGLLASVFTIYAILLIEYAVFRSRKKLLQAALILPYLVNIKFTGLVYSLVFTAIVVLFSALSRKGFPQRLVATMLVGFLSSVAIIGFNPYVTNLIEKRNLFYPAYQPQAGKDVLSNQAVSDFLARNRFEKFAIAQFSVPRKVGETFGPELVLPFTAWKLRPAVDSRFSGFGFAFSGILIIAVLQLLFPGVKTYRWFALAVMVTVFSTSAAWWARLAPQTWLAVCLLEVGAVSLVEKGRTRSFALVVLALMLVNSLGVFGGVIRRQGRWSNAFFEHLEIARKTGCSVQISDNRYGLFGFYNRRKVIDSLGESARIVDECQDFKRNRIFSVCNDASKRGVGEELLHVSQGTSRREYRGNCLDQDFEVEPR